MASLGTIWRGYANTSGILLASGILTLAIMMVYSHEGPVVELTSGPDDITTTVPYKGELSFRFSTQRHSSCPGQVVHRLLSRNGGDPVSVIVSTPIVSTDIKTTNDATVRFLLPESVYPGMWLYQYTIDSICPTFERQDEMFKFDIEVVR